MPVELFQHLTFLDPTTFTPTDWYEVTGVTKNPQKEVRGWNLTLSNQVIV